MCICLLAHSIIQVVGAEMDVIVSRLTRVKEIQRILIDQFSVLETMTPQDFLEFRDYLFPASGFQSVQFRLIENKLGLPPRQRMRYSSRSYCSYLAQDDMEEVLKAQEEPSLFDLVNQWLERTPFLKTEYDVGEVRDGSARGARGVKDVTSRSGDKGTVGISSESKSNIGEDGRAGQGGKRRDGQSEPERPPSRSSTPTFHFWEHYQSAVDRMFEEEKEQIIIRHGVNPFSALHPTTSTSTTTTTATTPKNDHNNDNNNNNTRKDSGSEMSSTDTSTTVGGPTSSTSNGSGGESSSTQEKTDEFADSITTRKGEALFHSAKSNSTCKNGKKRAAMEDEETVQEAIDGEQEGGRRCPFAIIQKRRKTDENRSTASATLNADMPCFSPPPAELAVERELGELRRKKESFSSIFDEAKHQQLVESGQRRLSLKALHAALLICLYQYEPVLQLPFRYVFIP